MQSMQGTVIWFDIERGYGFISPDEGQDAFVHYTAIQSKPRMLQKGDRVSFNVVESEKGLQATNVVKID